MRKLTINHALFILIIGFVVCVQNTWGPSIYILDEAKNATCAREMMESPGHIVPTFNYQLRTDKPPLHYYFMIASYKLFGVNPFGARFFSAVFGALTIMITFLYTRRLINKQVAFIAAFALITSLHFSLQFHLAVPDPYLVFFIALSVFAFIDGYINKSIRSIYLAYVAIGLGILAKGPIAIALPGFTVLLFILFKKQFNLKTISGFRPLTGLIISLIIALPWYLLVGLKTNWEWVDGFFFKHNLERFSDPQEGHGGSFLLTWIFVLVGMLPGSVYLIQSFKNWWNERKDDFLFFCGINVTVVVLFFSVADTRLPNYTVPAYPFLAVLIGAYIDKILNRKWNLKGFNISTAIVFFLYLVIPVGIYFGFGADPKFERLQPLWKLFIPVTLLGIAGLLSLRKERIKTILLFVAMGYLLFTALALNVVYPKVDSLNPVTRILSEIDTSRQIVYYERMNAAFPFYLKREIPRIDSANELNNYFDNQPDSYLITRSDYAEEIRNTGLFKEIYNEPKLFEPKNIVVFVRK